MCLHADAAGEPGGENGEGEGRRAREREATELDGRGKTKRFEERGLAACAWCTEGRDTKRGEGARGAKLTGRAAGGGTGRKGSGINGDRRSPVGSVTAGGRSPPTLLSLASPRLAHSLSLPPLGPSLNTPVISASSNSRGDNGQTRPEGCSAKRTASKAHPFDNPLVLASDRVRLFTFRPLFPPPCRLFFLHPFSRTRYSPCCSCPSLPHV